MFLIVRLAHRVFSFCKNTAFFLAPQEGDVFPSRTPGSPKPDRVGCVGHGQNPGQRLPKGRTKRLTFTEGRLRLTTSNASICIPWNALPDLKVRRLGRPCGGPMVLALIFRFLFIKKSKIRRSQKGRGRVPVRRRWRVMVRPFDRLRAHQPPAMTALG